METIDKYCGKCGVSSGMSCRTPAGNYASFHSVRKNMPKAPIYYSSDSGSVRLSCWKLGWEYGSNCHDKDRARKHAGFYFRPKEFMRGWSESSRLSKESFEKARQLYMNGK